jgi:hypothetical protein
VGLNELRQIREDRDKPKEKKIYFIPKVSAKRQQQIEVEGKIRETTKKMAKTVSGTAELNRWFEERRAEMTGFCKHCGGKTSKDSEQYYKFCIAHILPKRIFKSVSTNPNNWVELCFFGKSCHTNLDNNMLDIIDLNCFDLVIQRFVAMYPAIDAKERRYIPDVLLQYVEVEK